FNTKMADGPDEYDTEAGCVPLLHPENGLARCGPLHLGLLSLLN
ncbi:ZDHHC17 isoform 4, partial [Pongo abelii]